jgi:hypothetical protein
MSEKRRATEIRFCQLLLHGMQAFEHVGNGAAGFKARGKFDEHAGERFAIGLLVVETFGDASQFGAQFVFGVTNFTARRLHPLLDLVAHVNYSCPHRAQFRLVACIGLAQVAESFAGHFDRIVVLAHLSGNLLQQRLAAPLAVAFAAQVIGEFAGVEFERLQASRYRLFQIGESLAYVVHIASDALHLAAQIGKAALILLDLRSEEDLAQPINLGMAQPLTQRIRTENNLAHALEFI